MKKTVYTIFCSLLLLFLLIRPADAFQASISGLSLWFDTLIPTLFPFMILSGFLVQANLVKPFVSCIAPFMKRFFCITFGGTYAIFIGFLCGYPMGAKTIRDLIIKGDLSLQEGNYLLGFCSNISPAFVITFLVTRQLKKTALVLPTLFILYGSPLTYALLKNISYQHSMQRNRKRKRTQKLYTYHTTEASPSFSLMDQMISDAVGTIVKLGGYIIIFSILTGIINSMPLPISIKACITGCMEITNGIPAITAAFSWPSSFLFLMIFTSFGGLCSLAQTYSIIKNTRLSLKKYVCSKVIISIIALIYTLIYLI